MFQVVSQNLDILKSQMQLTCTQQGNTVPATECAHKHLFKHADQRSMPAVTVCCTENSYSPHTERGCYHSVGSASYCDSDSTTMHESLTSSAERNSVISWDSHKVTVILQNSAKYCESCANKYKEQESIRLCDDGNTHSVTSKHQGAAPDPSGLPSSEQLASVESKLLQTVSFLVYYQSHIL